MANRHCRACGHPLGGDVCANCGRRTPPDHTDVVAEQAARIAQLQQTLHHRTAALHRLVAKAADQDAAITALKARNRELEENQA